MSTFVGDVEVKHLVICVNERGSEVFSNVNIIVSLFHCHGSVQGAAQALLEGVCPSQSKMMRARLAAAQKDLS